MFGGEEFARIVGDLGITHVIWLPDSVIGTWERDLERSAATLVRVCREGEAWPLAAGLLIGSQRPLVLMQTTGLFESGDALRHVVYDLELPVYALIGARNANDPDSQDSAKRFAEPLLRAWGVDFVTIDQPGDKDRFAAHYRQCSRAQRPGITLLAE